MPTEIETPKAVEKSTFIVTATFRDENKTLVVPDTMKWSLTDKDSTIINSRDGIVITSLASSVDIVLFGDDLAILAGKSEELRFLVLEGTYTSPLGVGLPLNDQLIFTVFNIRKVT